MVIGYVFHVIKRYKEGEFLTCGHFQQDPLLHTNTLMQISKSKLLYAIIALQSTVIFGGGTYFLYSRQTQVVNLVTENGSLDNGGATINLVVRAAPYDPNFKDKINQFRPKTVADKEEKYSPPKDSQINLNKSPTTESNGGQFYVDPKLLAGILNGFEEQKAKRLENKKKTETASTISNDTQVKDKEVKDEDNNGSTTATSVASTPDTANINQTKNEKEVEVKNTNF